MRAPPVTVAAGPDLAVWEAWGQAYLGSHEVGNSKSFTIENTRLASNNMHY